MIRLIAAIDSKRGIATDRGVPWRLPTDRAYWRDKVKHDIVLAGSSTFRQEIYTDKQTVIASRTLDQAPAGCQLTRDAADFVRDATDDVWVIGGAHIYSATIAAADELYLTLVDGDFSCTKFFPDYQNDFECVDPGQPLTENGITFRFTIWRKKQ